MSIAGFPVLRSALPYIRPHRGRLALVLALSLISTTATLYMPLLTRSLIDDALIARNRAALIRIAVLFGVAVTAGFALNVAAGLVYTRTSARILFAMRLDVYRHLQRLSPRFYARTRLGDIVSRLNNDVAELQRIAAELALAWVGNVLFLAGALAAMAWLDLRLLFVSLVAMPFTVWALVGFRRTLEQRTTRLRERSADIGSFLIETLQGMRLVVASNAQTRETGRFRGLNDRFIEALTSVQIASYGAGGLPGLLLSAGTVAVFVYGGMRVIDGASTVGVFVAFMTYQMGVLAPLQGLLGLYASLATARASYTRVREILDAQPEVIEAPGARPLDTVRGDVVFDAVTASFGRGAPVLDRVSFSIAAGRRCAVVGPSGAGKSTIADLLLRLIDPDSGSVAIDGVDLRAVRLEDLRRQVGLVEQTPFLLHASIVENVRYSRPDASDADVSRALEAAGLAAFVASLPEGLATVVGERGLALSAGERQRLALARAMLARPAVLVLDEPTAALDPAAEQAVLRGLDAAARGRTTIIITHRLDLALAADLVLVLDDARIVESGSPSRLLDEAGRFASMFRRDAAATP